MLILLLGRQGTRSRDNAYEVYSKLFTSMIIQGSHAHASCIYESLSFLVDVIVIDLNFGFSLKIFVPFVTCCSGF